MAAIEVIWDLDDDPDGNVMHIAEHGVTQDEVVEVLRAPLGQESSRSSGRPIAFGLTSTGKLLAVIYELVEQDVYYPVTAYEVEEN
jgi:hypothetical protein